MYILFSFSVSYWHLLFTFRIPKHYQDTWRYGVFLHSSYSSFDGPLQFEHSINPTEISFHYLLDYSSLICFGFLLLDTLSDKYWIEYHSLCLLTLCHIFLLLISQLSIPAKFPLLLQISLTLLYSWYHHIFFLVTPTVV